MKGINKLQVSGFHHHIHGSAGTISVKNFKLPGQMMHAAQLVLCHLSDPCSCGTDKQYKYHEIVTNI